MKIRIVRNKHITNELYENRRTKWKMNVEQKCRRKKGPAM